MAAFTLEQLDMVRRLKQSGLSKDDILMAFDSFDATEKELGSTFQFPASIVCVQWLTSNIFLHELTSLSSHS